MSARPAVAAAGPDRLFHFVDGGSVVTDPERVHVSTGRGQSEPPAVPIAAPTDVAELLDHCAAGLARWLAIGAGARRRILIDVSRLVTASTFEIAEAAAEDLGISCELAVQMVSNGIDRLQRAAERPASSRLPVGVQAVVVGHRLSPPIIADSIWPMLLGGSIVVIRPAPDFARAPSVLAASLSAAGLPDGVFNVIHGDAATAVGLMGHPAVAGILAVGTSNHLAFVARSVARMAKPTVLVAVRP